MHRGLNGERSREWIFIPFVFSRFFRRGMGGGKCKMYLLYIEFVC